jgi:AcrR family transcriptional regulator
VRLPAEQRRSQLLDVATELFADRGFHATSMDDIAEAAGVTKPVLYQHFPSKRALYRELLEAIDRELTHRLVAATDSVATGRERVQEGFAVYFRYLADHRAAVRLIFGASLRDDPEFAAAADATVDRFAEFIAGLIAIDAAPEHRRALAHAMVGMAEATSRRFAGGDGADDPDVLARWLAEMAWFGLRGVRADLPALDPS